MQLEIEATGQEREDLMLMIQDRDEEIERMGKQ